MLDCNNGTIKSTLCTLDIMHELTIKAIICCIRNLETVPPLIDLCVKHIVDNFEANPLLSQLLPPYDLRVLEKLPPTVSLESVNLTPL